MKSKRFWEKYKTKNMKTFKLKFTLILCVIFLFQITKAQEINQILNNPSFEDSPRPGITPRGWFDCGRIHFPNETPPDVHPEDDYIFGVHQVPMEGETYLGLVVRENDTWESIAQELTTPLDSGHCYSFSLFLSRSDIYKSTVRGSDQLMNFTNPIKLRLWGGTGYCEKIELLAESDLIENSVWENFTFYLKPKTKVTYIVLEAFYKTPVLVPPNGNILLDDASLIKLPKCDNKKRGREMVRTKLDKAKLEDYKKRFKQETVRYKKTGIQSTLELNFLPLENINKIKLAGSTIDFTNNKLTPESEIELKNIAKNLEDFLSDYQLVIDFNGMEIEDAKQREKSILKILNTTKLTNDNYEIRNSEFHFGKTNWLVRKRTFYLGISLNEKK